MVVQLAPLSTNFSRGFYDFFHHCVDDGGVRTPVDGMASQKYNHSDRSAVGCSDEVNLQILILPYYKVTRDDKSDKFTLQTDLSKYGHACEPSSLAMRAKVKATMSIVVALSIQ